MMAQLRLIKSAFRAIQNHLQTMYNAADPIQAKPIAKKHFYFPLFITIFTIFYGTAGHICQYGNHEKFNLATLSTNPVIYTHQSAPRVLWSQIDFIWSFDALACLSIYTTLISSKPIARQFQIIKNHENNQYFMGNRPLGSFEAAQIEKYRSLARLVQIVLGIAFFLFAHTFFLLNAFFNGVIFTDTQSVLFWLVLFPINFCYISYAIFSINGYIALACKYIRIRQQAILDVLIRLNGKIIKGRSNRQQMTLYLWYFIRINSHLVYICSAIKEFARYCLPILSTCLPFYIGIQCYIIYSFLFIPFPTYGKIVFGVAVVECNLFLLAIVDQCARVVKMNGKILKQNGVFYLRCPQSGGRRGVGVGLGRHLIKIEGLQDYKLLRGYAFRVLGNYQITSKTFHLIFSYISIFFMYITKNELKHNNSNI